MLVKKIIVDNVYLENFSRTIYDSNQEVDIPYLAGKFQNLIPKEKEQGSTATIFNRQFINDSFLFNETIQIGIKGVYFLILQKGYKIDSLLYQPDELNIDLYVHKDGRLIYCFYNLTEKRNIIIKGKVDDDLDDIPKKLRANLDDLIFRNYFIKLATNKDKDELTIPEYYPPIMTANQLASYLNVKEKTIRTWTSKNKIPKTNIGGTVRYKKEDIDKFIKANTEQPKNR